MKVFLLVQRIVIMNRVINFIIVSMLFSAPLYDFKFNNSSNDLSRSNGSFPDSNGIIDIELNYCPWNRLTQ